MFNQDIQKMMINGVEYINKQVIFLCWVYNFVRNIKKKEIISL